MTKSAHAATISRILQKENFRKAPKVWNTGFSIRTLYGTGEVEVSFTEMTGSYGQTPRKIERETVINDRVEQVLRDKGYDVTRQTYNTIIVK